MNQDFHDAVSRMLEVVMFENWLRFYFIAEENDKLVIRLPKKSMEQLRARYASLYGLAEDLNGLEIDHQTSLRSVCMFVAKEIDGRAMSEDLIARVLDSPQFHIELQLFGSWVQAHEEQLDEHFLEFKSWREKFSAWEQTPEVRQYVKDLMEKMLLAQAEAPETTQ